MTSIVNELRIGNWLYRKSRYSGEPPLVIIEVDSIGEMGINLDSVHESVMPDFFFTELSPIQITAAILERARFKNDHSTFEYVDGSNNGKLFITWMDDAGYVVELRNGERNILVELKWVHQLQNFFFFLFGEELPITL